MCLAPTNDEIASFIPLGNLENHSARVLRDAKTPNKDGTNTEKKKTKKKKKRQNKKSKKAKKAKKNHKKRKSGLLKKSRKQKSLKENNSRQAGCTSDEACLTAVVKFMKIATDKVGNYVRQKSRIEKYQKLAISKGSKKSEFSPLLVKLKEIGGGNFSALTCGGSTTSPAAQRLQLLAQSLAACEANIQQACVSSVPTFDANAATSCMADMDAFNAAIGLCFTSTSACTCWNNANLETLANKLTACNLATSNNEFTKTKNTCTSAFGACRSLQDEASQAIDNCQKSVAAVEAKIASVTKTKDALVSLKAGATAIANQARQSRTLRSIMSKAISCSGYVSSIKTAVINAEINPSKADSSTAITALVNQNVAACTADEKTSLKSLLTTIDSTIAKIDGYLNVLKSDLVGKYQISHLLMLVFLYFLFPALNTVPTTTPSTAAVTVTSNTSNSGATG